MAEFLGKPFMGPESVPHVSADFFKVYFAGAHVSRAHSVANNHVDGRNVCPHADRVPLDDSRGVVCCVLQLAVWLCAMPGRILGMEVRPRKFK